MKEEVGMKRRKTLFEGYSAGADRVIDLLLKLVKGLRDDVEYRVVDLEVSEDYGVLVAGWYGVYYDFGRELKKGSVVTGEEVKVFIGDFLDRVDVDSERLNIYSLAERRKVGECYDCIFIDFRGNERKFEIRVVIPDEYYGDIEERVVFEVV